MTSASRDGAYGFGTKGTDRIRMVGARIILIAIAAIGLAIPPIALASDSVLVTPGRWHLVDRALSVTENGRETIAPSTKVHDYQRYFRCVGPEGAVGSLLPSDDLNGGSDCQPTGTVAEGHIALAGLCEDSPAGPISFSLEGAYNRQDIHIIRRIHMGDSQHRVIVAVATDGRFVGPCKGDEEK